MVSAASVHADGWGCCKQNVLGRFDQDNYLDLVTVEAATGKLRIYPGTASGALDEGAVIDSAGTAWGNRDLAAVRNAETGRHGLLAKDASGSALLFPSIAWGRGTDWTDPISYGPRA